MTTTRVRANEITAAVVLVVGAACTPIESTKRAEVSRAAHRVDQSAPRSRWAFVDGGSNLDNVRRLAGAFWWREVRHRHAS